MYSYSYRQHPFRDYSNKRNGKVSKVKVKETDPTWSQILIFTDPTWSQTLISPVT